MINAGYILVINMLVAALLCASFLAISMHRRVAVPARWFAAAYACGMVYVGGEAVLPLLTFGSAAVYMILHAAFLAALALLDIGIARRYGRPVPWRLIVAILVVSQAAFLASWLMPRDDLLRMFLYQTPFAVMQFIGAWIVLRSGSRRRIDMLLVGFLSVNALHYLSKPIAARLMGGPGASAQDYVFTPYALYSQSLGTVLVVAAALLLLGMLVNDILKDVTIQSETDALSGLLNRRGFEQRLGRMVARHRQSALPLSLIVIDLDGFKAINDTHGHAAGDRVIAAFADTLRSTALDHHVLGRVGGEEYAVLLPGSNMTAARLLAETVRATFSEADIEGFAGRSRFTASFGVAEMAWGETDAALFMRADEALYDAKRAGRNCVRMAASSGRAASMVRAVG